MTNLQWRVLRRTGSVRPDGEMTQFQHRVASDARLASTSAGHQQNGKHRGNAHGNHDRYVPFCVESLVRSSCQEGRGDWGRNLGPPMTCDK